MKIKEISVSNWRSIRQLDIEFENMMVFIGQNNHGKSNILSALLFFFGEIKPQELDFNKEADELHVEIIFSDLDEYDCITFQKYLTSQNEIRVRKTEFLNGSFEYRGYIQNPVEGWLQEANAGSYTKRDTARSLPLYNYLPEEGRLTKQDIIEAQSSYIRDNEVEFSYELEVNNFLGAKSVAKGIFGEVYFIPAIKDATDDLSTKEASSFGKLYSSVIDSMSETNADWRAARDSLHGLFQALNRIKVDGQENTERPQELVDFESDIAQELTHWGASIDVEVVPPEMDSVFKANTKVWIDDGVKTDIRRKGHGLQRALIFALIKVVADRLKAADEEDEEDGQRRRAASKSAYYILEEPELYLHPQAQRALFDTLVNLSEAGSQVLLCTHSSSLIELERYKSICIVRKDSDEEGTKVCQHIGELFEHDSKKDFNLAYWINPDRSELFFSSKVALVEGATDKTVIPMIARNIGVFRYDVTLIDCGSKTNIPLYSKLLNSFSIPYVAVYDKDHQDHKDQPGIDSANKATRLIEDAIDSDLGSSVVFENDIEEELGMAAGGKNKPHIALTYVNGDEFSLSEVLKNKIEIIYS